MSLLVYVWLGERFPDWARTSLLLSKQTSGLSTLLLSSRKVGVVPEAGEQVYLEDFYRRPRNMSTKMSHYFKKNHSTLSGFRITSRRTFQCLTDREPHRSGCVA